MAKKKSSPTRDLADATYDEFAPWVNVWDCGMKYRKLDVASNEWVPQIVHSITKQDREQFRDWMDSRRGEDAATGGWAASTSQASPRRFFAGKYTSLRLDEHIQGGGQWGVSYYTSSPHGRGILYPEIDAHHPDQIPDVPRAIEVLAGIFPGAFDRTSPRGHNFYVKVVYGGQVRRFNAAADRLEDVLQRVRDHHRLKTDFEVKGTITTERKSGRLAKFPFTDWTWDDLKRWRSCRPLTLVELERLIRRLEEQYPEAEQPTAPAPTRRIRARDRQDDSRDRFRANVRHTMELARRLGRVPEVEEVLDHLEANKLFTGEWDDNEEQRARRIDYILEHYVAPTFDPNKCGGFPVDRIMSFVDAGRQWAAAKFGSEVLSLYGRRVVRINGDVLGVYFGLCRFIWEDSRDRDGGIPHDRLKGLWEELHALGLIPHEWHYVSVYRYCRTFLHSQQVIEMTNDGKYGPNTSIIYRKGQNFPGAYKARQGSGSSASPRKTFCGRPLACGSGRLLKVHFGQGPVTQKRGQGTLLNLSSMEVLVGGVGKGRDPPD